MSRFDALSRAVAGVALLLAPVAALVTHVIGHGYDRNDKAAELAYAASHPDTWRWAVLLGLLAGILLVPAALALAGLARERGGTAARVGAALVVFGAMGQFAMSALSFVLLAVAQGGGGRAAQVELVERVEATAGFPIVTGLLIGGTTVGLIVLAAGLLRAGAGPRWAPLVVIASQIVIFATPPASPALAAVGFGLLVAGLGSYGIRFLRAARAGGAPSPARAEA